MYKTKKRLQRSIDIPNVNESLPSLIETVQAEDAATAQDAYDLVTTKLLEPWHQIIRRRPNTRTPCWNTILEHLWMGMSKERSRARRPGGSIDWYLFEHQRGKFELENRRGKRGFRMKTEKILEKGQQNVMAKVVRMERRRRGKLIQELSYNDRELNPA